MTPGACSKLAAELTSRIAPTVPADVSTDEIAGWIQRWIGWVFDDSAEYDIPSDETLVRATGVCSRG